MSRAARRRNWLRRAARIACSGCGVVGTEAVDILPRGRRCVGQAAAANHAGPRRLRHPHFPYNIVLRRILRYYPHIPLIGLANVKILA